MRKTGKRIIAMSLACTMVLTLAACGKKADTKPAETTKAAETTVAAADATTAAAGTTAAEPVELRCAWWGGDGRHEATEKAIAAFEAKYPTIKVTPEYGAWSGWEEKQALNIVAGDGADVMQINWNWIESYSQGGTSFANLEDYADVLDLTQFPENAVDLCKADEKLMAVPISLTGRLFYWNKTTFDEIGCAIPTDEASLFAAGAAFKAKGDDYYPLTLGEYDRMTFMVYYLESVYGKAWVEDGKLNYTEEEIKTGIDFINRLQAEHVIPSMATINGGMTDSFDQDPRWINGQFAGMFVWDSGAPNAIKAVSESVDKPGQEFVLGDFVKFGEYQGGFTKISMCFAVAANSKHPKEAAMLINFLLNDPEGIEIASTERGIPCSKAAIEVLNAKNIGNAMVKEANAKVLAYSKFPLDSKFESNDLKASPDGVYYKIFGKLSSGDLDSATAAKDLMAGINEC
ncbi:MAG: ABC transporter substrate-binding protein, partial [Clostridium sp.]